MRRIMLILGLLAVFESVIAAKIKFSERSWDFGTIAEEGGIVRHSFTLTNTSSVPVVIFNIRSSCGCTTSEYSREPVAPGRSATIEVMFDPRFRGGYFTKDINIYNSATDQPEVLTITGFVEERKLTIEEEFPFTLGHGARIERCYATLWGAEDGDLVQTELRIVNDSDEAVEISFEPLHASDELRLYYDTGVAPGERASLGIGYFIERKIGKHEEGLRDTVLIRVNGELSDKRIYIQAPFDQQILQK